MRHKIKKPPNTLFQKGKRLMIKVLLMSAALSLDCFAAGIGLASDRIKIPPLSAAIVSFVGTVFLGGSLLISQLIEAAVSVSLCRRLSCGLLLFLGIFCLFQQMIKRILRKSRSRDFCLKCSGINLVISLYLDETKADCDRSKSISPKEALTLSAALSADSILSGISAGLARIPPIQLLICTFISGTAFLLAGSVIGNRLAEKSEVNVGWLSGIILILLAFI